MYKKGELLIKFFDNEKEVPQQDFQGYTFIVPAISVGNVGQLSIDILLCSLKFIKVAIFHHPALLPIIGYDPYDKNSDKVSTAADLQINLKRKLVTLQIRSLILKEKKSSFLNDLNAWIKSTGFESVIILGSCYAHFRHDAQLNGSQFRYLFNHLKDSKVDELKSKGYIEFEEREDEFGVKKKNIPGSGFLCKLLETCEVPAIAFVKFVDEGDNSKDAFALVEYLDAWTKFKTEDQTWTCPFSWKNMFGPPCPSSLY